MIDIFPTDTAAAIAALIIVAAMFAGFLTERWPAEVVALAGVSVMLVTGILPYERAVEALSNPAPWTIPARSRLTHTSGPAVPRAG